MPYAYTPQIWPSLLSGALLIALAVYSGRRSNIPGATPFITACLLAAAWTASSAMEFTARDLAAKIAWHKLGIVFQSPILIAISCFFLEYTWPGRWVTRRRVILSSIPYLAAILLQYNKDLHPFFLRFAYDGKVVQAFGPYGWFILAYTFVGFGILNLVVLVWLFQRSPQHRWPVALMLAGMFTGRVIYSLDVIGTIHSHLPLNVLGMAFEFLMYAVALFGFRILDPTVLARQAVTVQMREGMLVLDHQGRIAGLNPAAERIFGIAARRLLGQPALKLLPACPAVALARGQETEIEFNLGAGTALRNYTLGISSLKDWRDLAVGSLLILRDVTDQKQAQAQILEQQRALALLCEREQLARELHDSTGQVLGYASFQLEVVRDLILGGQAAVSAGQVTEGNMQLTEAGKQLMRLGSVVEQAHADLREEILNLRLAPTSRQPLLSTLRQYLDGFSQNYAIQTELSVDPGVDESRLNPEAQMELFRVIQEALSNARKHSRATCVQIGFAAQDYDLRIQIQDNGRGFEPAMPAGKNDHFGLRFMRERIERLGGSLQIESSPGAGTRVSIGVPLRGHHV